MNKEIHFYKCEVWKIPVYGSWDTTEKAIMSGESFIRTLQMGLLSFDLFERGYKVFIHNEHDDCYELDRAVYEEFYKGKKSDSSLFNMWFNKEKLNVR